MEEAMILRVTRLCRVQGSAVAAICLAALLAGCASSSSSGALKGASHPAQVLTLADEGTADLTPADLDPPAENLGAGAIEVISLVYGGLVRLDSNLHVAPDGASSWTVSHGGTVYTFHIRKGLKFADGTPCTATDFAYSLNRAFSPHFANGNTGYYLNSIVGGAAVTAGKAKTISGVRVLNQSTLRITIAQPSVAFLDQLAFSASYAVPRRVIKKYGSGWTAHAIGTGPFYVRRVQHSKEIDLAPNRYYWRGKPKLSQVRVLFFSSADSAYNEYRSGGLDVVGAVSFPPDKLVAAQKRPDFHLVPQLFTEYLTPNEKNAPFNNVHVRRAFSLAVDRNILTSKFLHDQFAPAHGILPPGIPGYDSKLKGQTFSPTTAKAELTAAGYHGKGLPSVTLSYSSGDPGQQAAAPVLQRLWSKYLGVNVQLQSMEQGAYNNALTARNYQLAFISWGADYPDPQNFLSLQLQTGSGNNNGSFSDKQFDALTHQADVTVNNDAKRFALYRKAEVIALDKAAWIVLWWGKSAMLIEPKVHGLVINAGGLTARNWADVTIQ
jgi:ABC-type transport system substrate-binding protein